YPWWYSVNTGKAKAEPPNTNQLVRMGIIKLPYGMGIIITAYQHGGHTDIVLHDTIVDADAWKHTIAEALVYWYGELEGGNSMAESLVHDFEPSVKWVLWRMAFKAYNTSIEMADKKIPIGNVYVFLEMPVYFKYSNYSVSNYFFHLEEVYWSLVEPVFGLAYHFILPQNITPRQYYARNYTNNPLLDAVHPQFLPNEIIGTNTTYKGHGIAPQFTPFTINYVGGGVCNHLSRSTSIIASNALASYSAYMVLKDIHHSISLLIFPSSKIVPSKSLDLVNSRVDVDKDGKNDTSVIINDIKSLRTQWINWDNNIQVDPEYPLQYTDPYTDPYNAWMLYYYMDIPQSLTNLPTWLQTPWLPLFKSLILEREELAYRDFTEMWSSGIYESWTTNPDEYVEALFNSTKIKYNETNITSPTFWVKVYQEILTKKLDPRAFQPPSTLYGLTETLKTISIVYSSKSPNTSIIYREYFNATLAENITAHSNYWWSNMPFSNTQCNGPRVKDLNTTIYIINLGKPGNMTINESRIHATYKVYTFNRTYLIGNTTIRVEASISVAAIGVYIHLIEIPYCNYNTSIQLIFPNGTIITKQAKTTFFWYRLDIEAIFPIHTSEEGIIEQFPAGTRVRISINPINLTVVIPVK
ncbi:MAG: hypothetical protein GSR79_04075, partial [Desulfurococcales archaeon]|nr:hypothetical protein [Desulfurococcales archaeon]